MLSFVQFERELTSERTKDKLLEGVKKNKENQKGPSLGSFLFF